MSGTRNKNGEGSIFQVAENKWVAKISLGTKPDGKTIVKQFSGKTEAIVKRKLKDFKKSACFEEKRVPNNATVCSYFSKWLREYQYNKLKSSSYDRLESTVNKHIFPNIGGLKIDRVTRDVVQALINQLYKKEKLSYSSIKKVYVALNSCYNHALIDDVVTRNPCVGVELPSQSERTKQVAPLEQEEIKLLKDEILKRSQSATSHYYDFAYILILNTGLRMGETLSLRWEDIDFKNKTITVTKNTALIKKRDPNGNAIGGYKTERQTSTKTSNGNRVVPMNRSAETALLRLKAGNTTQYVVTNSRHNPVLPSNFERSFHSLLTSAGINKNYGIHALRHTFASMLFSKGVDVKIVSNLLGHSSVKITYDTYVHLFKDDIKFATNVLD